MNWIKFYNHPKFQVIEHFKYTGPLKRRELNTMWSNFSYYSVKIKFPKDFDIGKLKGRFTADYGLNDTYYSVHFEIINVRGLSFGSDYKILKVEVEGLELTTLPLEMQRDYRISDLIENEN